MAPCQTLTSNPRYVAAWAPTGKAVRARRRRTAPIRSIQFRFIAFTIAFFGIGPFYAAPVALVKTMAEDSEPRRQSSKDCQRGFLYRKVK